MRNRVLGSLLVAAALCSGGARAADLSGWIGGSGTRFDSWSPPHDSSERLHLDAGLNASGYVFSPQDIDWRGNLQYGRNRASYTGSHVDDDVLTYGVNASLFDTRGSSFALRLGGDRSQTDLTQSAGGSELTGTSLTSSLKAEARGGGDAYPTVSLGGYWSDTTNSAPDRPDLRRTTKALDATAGHGGDGYTYQLSYGGRIENGTLPALDYTSQTLSFNGRAQLTGSTELGLFGQHFTRSPTTSDGTNPKYDDTNLSATTWTLFPRFRLGTRYNFGHFVFESSAAPSTERYNHNFSLNGDRAITPEWSVLPSIGVSYTQDRLGTTETTAAGQSAGASVRWSPRLERRSILLEAGGRVGLLEPAEGATAVGWGTTASGRYGGSSGATQYGASYRLDYDKDMNAIAGWTITQVLSGDLSRPLARSLSFASGLVVSAARSRSPLSGDSANRSASLTGSFQWPTYVVGFSAGFSDGVAGALASPIRGDALFVPPNFQTHSRSAGLHAAATFRLAWTLAANVRYVAIEGPDVPAQHELVYFGRIGYRIGQFVLGLEDTYRTVGDKGPDTRLNQVMFTFARTFSL
jgi:hypothetical protein